MMIGFVTCQGLGNLILTIHSLVHCHGSNFVIFTNESYLKTGISKICPKHVKIDSVKNIQNYELSVLSTAIPSWRRESYHILKSRIPKKSIYFANSLFNFRLKIGKLFIKFFKISDHLHDIERFKYYLSKDFGIEDEYNFVVNDKRQLRDVVVQIRGSNTLKSINTEDCSRLLDSLLNLKSLGLIDAIFLTGSREDRDYVKLAVPNQYEFCEDLFDKTLQEVHDKLKASYFIGVDSSIGHLAALSGSKILTFWNYANFWRIRPYSPDSYVIINPNSQNIKFGIPLNLESNRVKLPSETVLNEVLFDFIVEKSSLKINKILFLNANKIL